MLDLRYYVWTLVEASRSYYLSSWGDVASHSDGSSCCAVQTLRCTGSVVAARGLLLAGSGGWAQ